TPAVCPHTPSTPERGAGPATAAPTMTVRIYFHRDAGLVAVTRTVPRTSQVAAAALGQLLAGPSRAERAAGIASKFTAATAGMLRSVRIAGGVGSADFGDLPAGMGG